MHKLTAADREKIASAVGKAELKTSGEIATAVIRQSNDYAIYELSIAVLLSLIYGTLLVIFTEQIESWLQGSFWGYHSGFLTGFYVFSIFLLILILYFLGNMPVLDRLIVPVKARERWVKRRAQQHFSETGVGHTKDGTGILIFISLLEQRVELLADWGIAEKVSPEIWQGVLNHIIEGIKNGRMVDSLCESIEICGDLLSADFPRQADDVNELADGIIELDK
ncbi:MAG: TPM domain-containing protein [Candidatus Cloacimonetes bacterium]|nr:TPM domain-containing protein [Candidatus Cloacimonadota bacterium]